MNSTSRGLWCRLRLLAALVLLTTAALWGSYEGVYRGAVPLASSTTSGVLDVDLAKDALNQAQDNAVLDADSDAAGTGGFYKQIAVANQSLAAAEDVTGPSGRQTLRTVLAQIAVYADWIGHAGQVGLRQVRRTGPDRLQEVGDDAVEPADFR